MKKLLYIALFLIPLIGVTQLSTEQQTQIDSLQQVIKASNNDTIIVNSYVLWDNIIYISDPNLDFELNKKIEEICNENLGKALSIQERLVFKKQLSFAMNNLGNIYNNLGDNTKAIKHHNISLKIRREIGNKRGIASSLNNIGLIYMNQGDYAKAIDYFNKSLKLQEEIGDKQGMVNSVYNIGIIYQFQGIYTKAIEYYNRTLKIREEINDRQGIASSLNNIGLIYADQGNYAKAIEYHNRSLKIREELGDKSGIASSLNNIGNIYFNQSDYEKALEYQIKGLHIEEALGDKKGIASSLNNLGNIYERQGHYTKAIEYYNRSLKIREEIGNKKGIASSLNNIGSFYKEQDDYEKALEYYSKSLKISEEIGDKKNIANALIEIGSIYNIQGNYNKAFFYSNKGLSLAQEVGVVIGIRDAADILYESYKAMGKPRKALEMFELFISMRDSIQSEENQKELIRQEYKYAYEKKEALAISDQKRKDDLAIEANKKKNLIIGSVAIMLVLVLLFTAVVIKRLRITRKQKNIIQEQKQEVETKKDEVDHAYKQLAEKNNEIMDSINYAKRIQSAILPSEKIVKECLKDYFILYKPKDIVAGDFYWMEQKDNRVLFAAADCTGHGVPGAMVSVICNNGLKRSVREYGLTDPGQILDKTREIVIEEFEKSEEEVSDGMDIALCSLEGNILQYAGAHNPLWIIRNGEILETETNISEKISVVLDKENACSLIIAKADKQPIGKFDNILPYTTHTFELQKGDTIYLFSDGFVDQFGGEKGKKFKAKNFKNLLFSIQNEPMDKQFQLIDETFEKWRANLEQVDDVCVIGVKF